MRKTKVLLIIIAVVAGIYLVLNMDVTTRQGVNYQIYTIRIPLYFKLLGFFDRHYNYKELVRKIVKGVNNEKEKVMKIFEWTCQNIRKVPEGFPIIDDHVWHIIIRGYGTADQASDVFTTLCNYAGIDAFFSWEYSQDRTRNIPLSFVKIEGQWYIFDPYRGVYFKDAQGELMDLEAIRSKKPWLIEAKGNKDPGIDYAVYFGNLRSIKKLGLTRPNIQFPLKRIIFEVERWIK